MNALAAAGGGDAGATIAGIIGIIGAIVVYWVPAVTAWVRHVPNKGSVFVVNLFLGWTVIGWIVALAMAMRDPARQSPATR